jgi:hypothetical protein
MVPATAVEDDDDSNNVIIENVFSKNCSECDVEVPPVAVHVLGVVDEAAPVASSGLSRNRAGGWGSMGIAVVAPASSSGEEVEYVKGQVLEPSWNDVWFTVVFLLNVVAIAVLAVVLGIPAIATANTKENSTSGGQRLHSSSSDNPEDSSAAATDEEDGEDRSLQWILVLVTIGVAWSFIALRLLIRASHRHPEQFVRVAYFAAPALFLASCLALLLMGKSDGISTAWLTTGSVWAILSVITWRPLRKFVPFASATLRTAAAAVKAHPWLVPLSIGSVVIGCAWFALWALALFGCLSEYYSGNKQERAGDGASSPVEGATQFAMLFSLYWGFQVLSNTLHFITSGAVSSWWFFGNPELNGYDGSRAVTDSFRRASTYSFGSICMASLLNTIAQILESLMNSRSNSDAVGLLGCVLACLLSCVRAWLEYFNSFALVYGALYNADYVTSGRQVIQLFRHAGWKTFINDCLVFRVLYMAVFAAACLTGLTGMALAAVLWSTCWSASFTATDLALMFAAGFLMGLATCNPLLFLMESASRTIMVCLAEHPSEFAESHPDLFEILVSGWSTAYPEAWRDQKVIPQE